MITTQDSSTMSGYLSSLLTSSTEKYNTLRRTLQSEADGDTEDDSHISRALRNYYTDAGRGLPPWLPPDPKKASQTQVSYGQQGQYGHQQGQSGQPDPGYGQRPAYGQSQQRSRSRTCGTRRPARHSSSSSSRSRCARTVSTHSSAGVVSRRTPRSRSRCGRRARQATEGACRGRTRRGRRHRSG